MPVLSIQSSVAYGHVGNAAAVFPLQLLGHEVWPVDTVSFSNHPQYGGWRGAVRDPGEVREILRGVEERGAFARCDAVLSGYLGDPATGAAVLDAVDRVKAANADAIYCLDPVMGDVERGVYVRPGIPEFFREHALPRADFVIPNTFELEFLAGRAAASAAEAEAAAAELRAHGAGTVIVTGIRDGQDILVLAFSDEGAWRVAAPMIEAPPWGAGDLFAALFLGNHLLGRDLPAALGRAVSSIHGIFTATREAGGDALAIVAARNEITAPTEEFEARPL